MPVYLVQGMAFGDEGKGATVDALVRRVNSNLVVRFNGGAQAAHNVVTSEGKQHTFAQFGSGTFVPGVRTYLSRFVLVNPVSMMVEDDALAKQGIYDARKRMVVDTRCPIITPFQKAFNRITEMERGFNRHGSTGMGIGETRRIHLSHPDLAIVAEQLRDVTVTREKLKLQQEYYKSMIRKSYGLVGSAMAREIACIESSTTIDWYIRRYQLWAAQIAMKSGMPLDYHNPIFEGAQGVLLDETHGFQPHVTWTDCTFRNAETILEEAGDCNPWIKLGVWRCYFTRHGAGPMPSQNNFMLDELPEDHNKAEEYTGDFRVGEFDLPLAMYAKSVIGELNGIVINHFDRMTNCPIPVRVLRNRSEFFQRSEFIDLLEGMLRIPVVCQGNGPTSDDRSFDLEALDVGSPTNLALGNLLRNPNSKRSDSGVLSVEEPKVH